MFSSLSCCENNYLNVRYSSLSPLQIGNHLLHRKKVMFLSKTEGSGHKTLAVAFVKHTAQALGSWRGSPNLGLAGPGLSMCQFQVRDL